MTTRVSADGAGSDNAQASGVSSLAPAALGEPLLEPLVSRRPVAAVVAERITAAIAEGRLQPGDKLPSEPDLARELGVGRTSIREALSHLQARRIVRVERGRGTFIEEVPDDNPTVSFLRWSANHQFAIAELLEARIALEAAAAALACVRGDPADLSLLHSSCSEHAAASADKIDALVRTDESFHQALVRASHNTLLAQLYDGLVPQLSEFRRKTLSLPGVPGRSADDHDRILNAIERRDTRGAREAAVRHLSTLYEEVRAAAKGGVAHDQDSQEIVNALM